MSAYMDKSEGFRFLGESDRVVDIKNGIVIIDTVSRSATAPSVFKLLISSFTKFQVFWLAMLRNMVCRHSTSSDK